MKEIVLSGIRSTGNLHLGNYYGALRKFVNIQDDYDCNFFIADLHALTTSTDPAALLAKSYWEALGRGKRRLPPQPAVFTPLVAAPVVSVGSRIIHILRLLYQTATISLSGLFSRSRSRSEAVATFMAVLELMKAKRIRLVQEDTTILFLGRGEKEGRLRRAAE